MAGRLSSKRDRSEFECEPVTREEVQKLSDQMDKTSLRSSLRSPARKRRAAGHKTVPGVMNIEKTEGSLAREDRLPLPIDITMPVSENGGCNDTSRGLQKSSDELDGDDDKAGTPTNGAVTINQRSGDRPLPRPISIAVVHPTTGGKSLLSFAAPSSSIASETEDEDEDEAETPRAKKNHGFIEAENQVEVAHDRKVAQGRGKKWSLARLHHNYEADVVYVTEELLSEHVGEDDEADIIYHQEPGIRRINQARADKLIGAYESYYLLSKEEMGWSAEEERRRAETHIKVAVETNTTLLYPEDAGADSLEQKLVWVQSHINFTKENPDNAAIKTAHQAAGTCYAFTHLLPSWHSTYQSSSISGGPLLKRVKNTNKTNTVQSIGSLAGTKVDTPGPEAITEETAEKPVTSLSGKCKKILEIMMGDVRAGRYESKNSPEANITYDGDAMRDEEMKNGHYPGIHDKCFDTTPTKAYLPIHSKYGYWLVTLVAAGYSARQLVWLCGPIDQVPGAKDRYTKESLCSKLSMRVSRSCTKYMNLIPTIDNVEGSAMGTVKATEATKKAAGRPDPVRRVKSVGKPRGGAKGKSVQKP